MGQVLSNIINCLCCGEADDDVYKESLGLKLLLPPPCPTSQNEPITSCGSLPQTPLSSLPSSNSSCSDLSSSGGSSVHLTSWDMDCRCDETIISTELHQIAVLDCQQQCWDSDVDFSSTTSSAMHQSSHSDVDMTCVLHQEIVLTSSESFESLGGFSTSGLLELSNIFYSPMGVDLNINEVVENQRLGIKPLSLVNSIEFSGKEREREEEMMSKEVFVVKERWIKYYSSHQNILLVGEGDFSFSACLALAFGSAKNMIATSLNSQGFLTSNYMKARSNIQKLRSRGCMVMHDVDATEMANHLLLKGIEFDRIIFNFPLAGFFGNESRESQLRRNRELVRKFLVNANEMINEKGEVHITHKSNGFFLEWNVEFLAAQAGLELVEVVHFNHKDYPSYRTKYGFGGDKNFNCNPSKTYKFGLKKQPKFTVY